MSAPEKDCTNNENDNNDQTSSKTILIKDQAEENTTSVQAVAPSKKGSCLCTMASILVSLTAPNFVMLFAYTIIDLKGSLTQLLELLLSQTPQDILQQIWWPYILGNHETWSIIAAFVMFELLLMITLPGYCYTGNVTPKGNVPHYKDNGLLAFIITITGFSMLVYCDIFKASLIYNNFMYLIGALNLLGLIMSVILFIKGKYLPSSTDVTDAGSISGFFQGVELHPQILRCDVKLFINSRFGMMGWALLLLSYAYIQYEATGELTDSMGVAVSLQLIYIAKFFYWEQGYTRTWAIIHDKAGFYKCWGSIVWIPCVYTSHALYLVTHPYHMGVPLTVALMMAGVLSIYTNYEADYQKYTIHKRKTQAQPTTSTKSSPHMSPLPINKSNSPCHSSPAASNGIINSHSSPSQQVFKELVSTERVYVKDLASVMEGYYKEMEPGSMDVPLKLREKRETVFGNLNEIYEFHNSVFLQELEKYTDFPEDVGQCFLNHSKSFGLYENYCKNRSNSNALLHGDPACEAFFKDIQLKLGHDLPLSSYLLKPVQRITKYQLLLKELMDKCVDSEPVFASLKNAFDEMIKILRFLNQSMAVVGLKGFPGNLVDQGRLLAQEKFNIIDSSTKAALHMFARSKERHVFLFEKVLVFSKKVTNRVGDSKKPGSPSFLYKEHYPMTDISLRKVDDQKTCLHLTVFGQNKPVVLQVPSQQIKETWESEIHRLLEKQLSLLKEQALMSPTRQTELILSGPFASTLKRRASLAQSEPPSIVKPPINSPTTSAQSDSTGLSVVESDGEVGFYSDDNEEKLWGASNSVNEEDNITYESLAPGAHKWYKATSDYSPGTTDNDVALVEEQIVELLGVSQVGWWWVRTTNHDNEVEQGWVPASYLEMCSN